MSQTTTSPAAWRPDVYIFPPGDVVPDSLLMQVTTVSASIEGDAPAVRIPLMDDAAADFVAEGAIIPESDPRLSEAVVLTRRISLLHTATREQYHQPGAAERFAMSVARSIIRRADQALISQPAPTPPAAAPAPGLATTPNIQKLTTKSGGDGVIDAVASIEDAGGAATNIVCAPRTWAAIIKWRTTVGLPVVDGGGGGTQDAVRQLLGRPVLVNTSVPADVILVVDRSAVVSAAGPVEVATSEDAAFDRNGIQIRAMWRIGHAVTHPKRIAAVTITP